MRNNNVKFHCSDMKQLAEAVGQLEFSLLREFLYYLSAKLKDEEIDLLKAASFNISRACINLQDVLKLSDTK